MRALRLESLNPVVEKVEYAVRDELATKAEEYQVQLKEKDHGLPFKKVIFSNISDPQQSGLDQKPITFTRQVAALMEWPALADLAPFGVFPKDVIARAKELSDEIGSIGAYSDSQGVLLIRKNVAKFIEDRDGYPSNPGHIFLTGGAAAGVFLLLSMLIAPPNCGVLIPIPQCPLYTATIAQFSGTTVPYYLDETSGWSTSVKSVEAAIEKATSKGVTTKVLVIINPGNPTGALLDQETQARLVELCEKHSLILLADEVYQDNLRRRDTSPFTSFKKAVAQTQSPIPLVSFHSISKGVSGECGRRGGYFECTNISDGVIAQMYKMVSFGWSSPLLGQIGVNCMVRPPKAGDESYPLWKKETREIHEALAARNRTQLMVARLNSLPGVSCVDSLGTLYLHPRIELSESAISAARAAGKEPDAFYSLELLDQTGICVTPGSGFGQKENNWHYRLTCLCPGIEEYVSKLEAFHKSFLEKYCA